MKDRQLILTFLKSGLFTTIQDHGRRKLGSFGVPVGGWLDEKSARQANWLVGNHPDTPVLEITIQGPEILFSESAQIAVTGANISPKLNQVPIPLYETIEVNQDDILSFGRLQYGCRAYLAVRGRWEVEKELESYSLLFSGNIQPGQRGLIRKHHKISIKIPAMLSQKIIPEEEQFKSSDLLMVKVMPGPEFDWFSRKDIGMFFSYEYQLSRDSNRMGCRLEGHYLKKENDRELISSGVIPGTIQITNQGQPVVLLADAQTTGGYPRFGNVITEDLWKIGQLKPGDGIGFQLINE